MILKTDSVLKKWPNDLAFISTQKNNLEFYLIPENVFHIFPRT